MGACRGSNVLKPEGVAVGSSQVLDLLGQGR